jgi:hypothetical protein
VWLVFGNSDNLELTVGTVVYIAQLNLVELIADISNFLGYKNLRKGKSEFCEPSDCSTD